MCVRLFWASFGLQTRNDNRATLGYFSRVVSAMTSEHREINASGNSDNPKQKHVATGGLAAFTVSLMSIPGFFINSVTCPTLNTSGKPPSANERFAGVQFKRLNMSLQSVIIDRGLLVRNQMAKSSAGRYRWLFHFQLWGRVENNMVNRLIKDDGWRDWDRSASAMVTAIMRTLRAKRLKLLTVAYLSHHDAIERVWHHSNNDLWWHQPGLLSTRTVRPRSSMPWYNTQYTALILCP